MGLYSRLIFPWLCNVALDRAWVAERRRQLLAAASGEVLEIGAGTGLNLPHYPSTIQHLTTIDANVAMHRLDWWEQVLADGCHLNRNVRELVTKLPFTTLQIAESYLDRTPATHGYMYQGQAIK